MSDEPERHYPKGSMCMACAKQDNNCSMLDFASMPVLYAASLIHLVVRCTQFEMKATP